MSRIGKLPIQIPEGVEVKIEKNRTIKVKGPKGELAQKIHPDIKVKQKDGALHFERPTEQKRHKSYHGLYRSLVANMIQGVTEGFEKRLELVGVGFKATHQDQVLELSIGYSHDIVFQLPEEIKVETQTEKGSNPTIILNSVDKQLLGQVAAKVRALRPPEPYKGKGIRFVNEYIRRKAGKAAAATK